MAGQFFQSTRCMLASGKHADIQVKVGPRKNHVVFYLHKTLIVAQSEFFEACLKSEAFEEARTGVVHLPEEEIETFQRFIAVVYTDNYNDGLVYKEESDIDMIMMQATKVPPPPESELADRCKDGKDEPELFSVILESAKLYCMAEKLLAEDVKKAAIKRLRHVIHWFGTKIDLDRDHSKMPETLEALEKIVMMIYSKTAQDDVDFKERLCWLVSRQVTDQHFWVSLLPIFRRCWDFHMGVMAYIRKPAVVCVKCEKSSTTRVVLTAAQYVIYACFRCHKTRRITKRFLRWGSEKFGPDEWIAQERERIETEGDDDDE
ncbi:hypothetical protein PgNI_06425 [Pyricularia grisea]|uniref:BTB domain-containing protein n=1 Tax=Pyricularia grisea TaxID=148305 RepID=A0A6P8B415_PYRGI|nr:hypothetical protein PgNI_06425 [Pyricularia grisea]TLD10076.1 hypothetical protein PgNI_06425 [Pyricularia grisea]